ncbi:MAG TPA: response regulator transcription factor [Verrucomicrobiae bacterium]
MSTESGVKGKSAKAPAKKQILIVDDHPMMRDGLRQLIANEPDLEVCGEAEDAPAALELAESCKPDIAIVDITLRSSNGLELIKDLHIRSPDTAVLVLSMHDESLYAERVLRAGGRGYIMKQEGGKKIVEGVRRILSGAAYVSENISARILDSISGRGQNKSAVASLTDREFEVFQLIGQGLSTTEMAEKLHVSVKTIEVHRVNIKNKLGVPTAPELIRFAVRWLESGEARP